MPGPATRARFNESGTAQSCLVTSERVKGPPLPGPFFISGVAPARIPMPRIELIGPRKRLWIRGLSHGFRRVRRRRSNVHLPRRVFTGDSRHGLVVDQRDRRVAAICGIPRAKRRCARQLAAADSCLLRRIAGRSRAATRGSFALDAARAQARRRRGDAASGNRHRAVELGARRVDGRLDAIAARRKVTM